MLTNFGLQWFPTWKGAWGAAIHCILMKFELIFYLGVPPNIELKLIKGAAKRKRLKNTGLKSHQFLGLVLFFFKTITESRKAKLERNNYKLNFIAGDKRR